MTTQQIDTIKGEGLGLSNTMNSFLLVKFQLFRTLIEIVIQEVLEYLTVNSDNSIGASIVVCCDRIRPDAASSGFPKEQTAHWTLG